MSWPRLHAMRGYLTAVGVLTGCAFGLIPGTAAARTTTLVNSPRVIANILASHLATPGSSPATATNPGTGGGNANAANFMMAPAGTNNDFTNGAADGLWTTAGNWSLGHVPLSTETATDTGAFNVALNSGAQTVSAVTFNTGGTLTISGGSLTFTSASTATNITMSGGTLTANGNLTVSGTLNWSGGTMNGTGITTSSGTMNLTGSSLNLSGSTLVNAGTANFTGSGTILMTGGAIFNNQVGGIVNAQSSGGFSPSGGGSGTVINAGTLTQPTVFNFIVGAGVAFNNSGTVNLTSVGLLTLKGGGSSSGSFAVPLGAILAFGSSGAATTLTGTSSVTGTGEVDLNPPEVDINGAYSVGSTLINQAGAVAKFNSANASTASLTLSAGTLSGTGNLTATGTSTWSGGTLSISGTLTIPMGATLNISGATTALTMDGTTLNIAGTVNVASSVQSGSSTGGNATISVMSTGKFNFTANASVGAFAPNPLPGTTTVNNAGTITNVAVGAFNGFIGTTTINTGTINVNSGGLNLGSTLTQSGANSMIFLNPNATNPVSVVATTFTLNGGTLLGSGSVYGNLTVNSGMVNPGGTGAAGTLTLQGNYVQGVNATLNIEIGQTGVVCGGTYDRLLVSGTATFSGTLNATSITGCAPNYSAETFQIMTFTSKTGDFTTKNLTVGGVLLSEVFNFNVNPQTLSLVAPFAAANINFNGKANDGGKWETPGNWDLNRVPTTTDVVGIGAGLSALISSTTTGGAAVKGLNASSTSTITVSTSGSLAYAQASEIGNLTISGGSLSDGNTFAPLTVNGTMIMSSGLITGFGGMTVNGPFSWSGGTITTTNTNCACVNLIANGGMVINLGTANTPTLGRTLTNNGTANMTGTTNPFTINAPFGNFYNAQGATFLSSGNQTISGTVGAFANQGTFTADPGTVFPNTLTFSGSFANLAPGVLNLNSGILLFNPSSPSLVGSSTGGIVLASGTILQFNLPGSSFGFYNGGSLTGAGIVQVQNGSVGFGAGASAAVAMQIQGANTIVNFSTGSTSTLPSLGLQSGTLTGTSNLTITGSFSSGGTISGSGTILVASGGGLNFGGILDGKTLNNAGIWSAGGASATLQNGAVFNNLATGMISLGGGTFAAGTGGGTFNNAGSFTFSPTQSFAMITFASGVPFNNSGTIRINQGTITCSGGFTQTAGLLNLVSSLSNLSASATTLNGGTVTGIGGLGGNPVNNGATIHPAVPTLNGTVMGMGTNYTHGSGATLLFDIGGTGATQYAQVNFGGTVTINGGALTATPIGAFTPAPNDAYRVMTFASKTGDFSTNNLTVNGVTLIKNFHTGDLTLTAPPAGINTFNNSTADNLWTTAANWSMGHVPTATEDVAIGTTFSPIINAGAQSIHSLTMTSTGTLTVGGTGASLAIAAASTATNISVGIGTLAPAGSLTISKSLIVTGTGVLRGIGTVTVSGTGVLSWIGGTIGGDNGLTTVASTATFLIGQGNHNFTAHTLINQGTATWQSAGANIHGGGGALFNNTGTFNVTNNAAFDNTLGGAAQFVNSGIFTKSVSGITAFSGASFTNLSTVNANAGTLNFSGGFTQSAGTTTLNGGNLGGGTLTFNAGVLNGNGTITGTVINNGAIVKPGFSPGMLSIAGSYTQGPSGVLNIELGGTGAGQFDVLAISATATLGGTINVLSLGGFTPVAGNSFQVMTFASHLGDFTARNLTINGVKLAERLNATNLTLIDAAPITSGDFDGDGKADVAVWRPSSGNWYIIPSSTPTNFRVQQWGASGDIPVRGDFDGDGLTDVAVWRPSNGTWYIIPSSNPSAPIFQQWGAQGDIPVPGDYDGDGKTDFAVFRPSNGTWYIIPSSNPSAVIVKQWGANGDIPVPGDYDGDGKTDFAVWRPSNGTWYIIPTSNPIAPIVKQWGAQGDMPVPGDYDGDAKTDFAVFRPSNGTWYIIPTSNPSAPIIQQWGTVGDIPVPVDYDGDQKTDIGVWRPSNGIWYIIPSSAPSTFIVTQWGTNGDVPVQKPIGQ